MFKSNQELWASEENGYKKSFLDLIKDKILVDPFRLMELKRRLCKQS